MPASTLHLRAFELGAGPKTARLVTVDVNKSIADVYTHLCSVLKLSAPLSRVTFHKTQDKKVDTTALSTNVPIGSLGLSDNDIFIIRYGTVARFSTKEGGSAVGGASVHSSTGALSTKSGTLNAQPSPQGIAPAKPLQHPPPQLSDGATSMAESVVGGNTASVDATLNSKTAAVEAGKDECADVHAASDVRETASCQLSRICLAADMHRVEGYRQQCAQHSYVTQVFVMKLFQLLAALTPSTLTAPRTSPQLGPTRSSTTVKDLHRELLTDFCRRAHLPSRQADKLLSDGARDMEAVYEALDFYVDLTTQSRCVVEKVREWLGEHIPSLRPAAGIICVLHESREAEYVEVALLRLLGHAPTSMTWLCLKDAALPIGRKGSYYSSIAQFSQLAAPTHVRVSDVLVLDAGELDSCCEGWGLNNASYKGHLLPLSPWVWSRTVAAVMMGQAEAAGCLCDLLGMYNDWEAALAWAG